MEEKKTDQVEEKKSDQAMADDFFDRCLKPLMLPSNYNPVSLLANIPEGTELDEPSLPRKRKETIPTALRPYYFTGLEPPDLSTYDAIGFEVDNCLVRYHMKPLTKLIIDALLTDLVTEFKYPQEVLQFNYERMLGYYLNYAVWDIERGTVLKLTNNCEVVQAVHGTNILTPEHMEKLYG